MAHYAFLDDNNIVVQVIVGNDEGDTDWEAPYASLMGKPCKRTSYNTRGGIYYGNGFSNPATEDQTKAFRKNYAGIGFTYDAERDAFIPPKQYESWVFNEDTCSFDPPVPYPEDGKFYQWNEETTSWVEIENA